MRGILWCWGGLAKPWYDKFASSAEDIEGLAKLVAKLNTFPNTKAIDLMTPHLNDYDLDMFMDLTHLNETGARRFTKELSERYLNR